MYENCIFFSFEFSTTDKEEIFPINSNNALSLNEKN